MAFEVWAKMTNDFNKQSRKHGSHKLGKWSKNKTNKQIIEHDYSGLLDWCRTVHCNKIVSWFNCDCLPEWKRIRGKKVYMNILQCTVHTLRKQHTLILKCKRAAYIPFGLNPFIKQFWTSLCFYNFLFSLTQYNKRK